jgi:hypothetical protein
MNQNIDYSPLLILLILPALLILIIYVGTIGSRKTRIERIERLREKVKTLPLDDKTMEKKLETFDNICEKIRDYETKIKLLEKIASGEEIKVKKRKEIFKSSGDEILKFHKKDDTAINLILYGRC